VSASFVVGESHLDHCVETLTLGSSRGPDDIAAWTKHRLLNQKHNERKRAGMLRSGRPVPCNVTRDAFNNLGQRWHCQLAMHRSKQLAVFEQTRSKLSPVKNGLQPARRWRGYRETRTT
jgi:hypothetical protein